MSYAVADGRASDVDDLFPLPDGGDGDVLAAEALDAIANECTDRAGRLLAPLAVRYVVVPVDDGLRGGQRTRWRHRPACSTPSSRQLDLRRVDSPNAARDLREHCMAPGRIDARPGRRRAQP